MTEIQGYYRHPTIHGDRVVFVAEDDLWTVPAAGGVARRLTASPGTVSFPVFSPDGRRVAFTGRDDGPAEAYVVDADGGDARRAHLARLVHRDGRLVEGRGAGRGRHRRGPGVSRATPTSTPSRPTARGAPVALRHGPARAISYEPAGAGVVIGRNSGDPARWKRYRGGTAGTIWIDRNGRRRRSSRS